MVRAVSAAWAGIRALCVSLIVALSLAAAPVAQAVKHGPAAMAAEADHRAYHAEQGRAHDIAGSDHHDPGDHDHVSAALLVSPGADVHPPLARTLRPVSLDAEGTIRDGPRRPPRLT
jgi:hypothetical protein